MNQLVLHPALRRLFRASSTSRIVRTVESFRSPRRLILSLIALALAILWVGQAVAGIVLREAADPARISGWIALSLTGYGIWSVLKVVFQKQVEPFEWTETERELLVGAPLPKSQLVLYRAACSFRVALLKSLIFTLVMIPDINILPLAFAGLFCALVAIDIVRYYMEVLVDMLRARERTILRVAVGCGCAVVAAGAIAWAFANTGVGDPDSGSTGLGFLLAVFAGLKAQANTWFGIILTAPAMFATSIILAKSVTATVLLSAAGLVLLIAFLVRSLAWFAESGESRKKRIERENFVVARESERVHGRNTKQEKSVQRPPRILGAGPLAWRQLISVRNYRLSLTAALLIPLILCCLPALSGMTGTKMFLNLIGIMAFYSFAWLPYALKLDFRRDVDRLVVLKSVPATPMQIVLGQLAAPVIVLSLFQLVTLMTAMLISPYSPALLAVGMAILIPFNVFIFGFENLMFLLYPHRMNQEGIHMFLRTILAFTAKGLIFCVGIIPLVLWMYASISISNFIAPVDPRVISSLVFSAGALSGLCLVAFLTLRTLAGTFQRFDPSCDLAGLD